jgi:hypothetical protein
MTNLLSMKEMLQLATKVSNWNLIKGDNISVETFVIEDKFNHFLESSDTEYIFNGTLENIAINLIKNRYLQGIGYTDGIEIRKNSYFVGEAVINRKNSDRYHYMRSEEDTHLSHIEEKNLHEQLLTIYNSIKMNYKEKKKQEANDVLKSLRDLLN